MAFRRTVDLLPEIFRTETNRKFLAATLDQLVQEPNLKRTEGFVGRRVGPGVNPADPYVQESSAVRADYQLEPAVCFVQPESTKIDDIITYPGILDALELQGADVSRQDRLFSSQYYAWDNFCDFDKFVNYSQYYWLPGGPDPVDVSSTDIPESDSFTVTRNGSYQFSGVVGTNPVITLVRGGNYTFDLNQVGHKFWIQAAPGITGVMPFASNISSRTVLGVNNNGEDQGTVTFDVPLKNAQDFYYTLNNLGSVDLVTDLFFNQINNVYVNEFLNQHPTGIDGITALNGRTVIFTNSIVDAQDGGWQITTQFDPIQRTRPFDQPDPADGDIGTFDTTLFDQTTDVAPEQRYTVWRIDYQYDNDGQPYMVLSSILSVPNLSKLSVKFGIQWSNTTWYKDASGLFEQVPLLTAILDTLWYQDSTNPDIFGQIKLVDQSSGNPLDLNEIIGAKTYTSPNGVTFTNGLKVQFRGLTVPAQFQDVEYYVEGVGTGPGLGDRVGFIDGEAYFGPFHVYQGQLMTGSSHDANVFHQYIYPTVEESIENFGAGGPAGTPLPESGVFGAAQGNGIKLIPVRDLVTPETYTQSQTNPFDDQPYDSSPWDATLNAPEVPDYLTINRAAADRNAWTRSNRWFHVDVIRYSAEQNNTVAVLDNDFRAKRPIIEFRAGLRLFNFGTQGKHAVDIIDVRESDAFSNINGRTGYAVDGYTFMQGTRVIFAADVDPAVRNRIWQVNFIDPDLSGTEIIDLVPAVDNEILIDQTVVSLSGVNQQGRSYWYDGLAWIPAQQKTTVNQAPLFDIYDGQGRSLSNRVWYPSSNFAGTRLFGYSPAATDIRDSVLGFALRYLNINNVGDIVFENFLYTDTFRYVKDKVGIDAPISQGVVRQYLDRTQFSNQIGWQTAAAENRARQVFRFVYDGSPLILDVPVVEDSVFPALQVFQGSVFLDPDQYTYSITSTNTFVSLSGPVTPGTVIEVQALSDMASAVAYYQVPINLESNALNQDSSNFTLGTIRTHYETIGQNLKALQGPINGANNSRDLGNITPYGDLIVQQSAPLPLAAAFLRRQQFDIFNALQFNSQEYNKYKATLLDLAANGDFVNSTPTQVLDTVIQEIAVAKNENSSFYWSDMLPSGGNIISNTYTFTPISTSTFDTVQTYNFAVSNYQGLLIYLNNVLLTKDYDYVVNEGPTVTITASLVVGDVIRIDEYASTVGSYVPNTPTKLGLYPAFRPEIYLDATYVTPTLVIRGHDGSITKAYGDFRDQVLLQFETRIFNNLKIQSVVPLSFEEVIPGQFRVTDYSLAEVNQILSVDFLNWVGWNKLDYVSQNYIADNPYTWNYNQCSSRIDGRPIPGAWRGAYLYFYDTTEPNYRPWEMLGLSEKPNWWEDTYGPAPYTSGNMVLWGDLESGLVADPVLPYVRPEFARPGLSRVIPVDSEGNLLPPLPAVVGAYDSLSFRRSWTFGDNGPTEAAWRNSSAYPFALMRLLALTKPAKFFSLFADRDLYVFSPDIDQYLWNQRYRLDASAINPIYGQGTSKASYIDWIVDYNQQLGVNSGDDLVDLLQHLDVRLTWRLGAFSDKKYLKIYSERSTPTSSNTSLLLPDESYQLLLYKNQPFDRVSYSSVIVQNTDDGWAVYGYDPQHPYFEILASRANGLTRILSVAGTEVRVPAQYTNNVVRVPYGFVFTNRAAVCDFLLSYGELLIQQGFTFAGMENGYIVDWNQMAQEFLYWTQQGWITGSMINLNPGAVKVEVTRPNSVAESILPVRADNVILNQNRQAFNPNDLVIDRIENTFSVSTTVADTINFLTLQFTSFEHVIVLDNVSIFADLIYQPTTGARQSRLLVSGWLSGDWRGYVDAPGFILNQNNIAQWRPNQTYTKGEIVLYKDNYWAAGDIIQPSQDFDYAQWLKSDYDQVQKGLLPNIANASDQLANAYNVFGANLEREVDLFSYGLIGFRPRQYMQALNLNDSSQVQLYQQFLGTKGTPRAAEFFSLADLGKEVAEYNIYEYWQLLNGTYGANANRRYFELLLDQSQLTSDPSIVQLILPQQTSQANQTVLIDDVWKSSWKITTPNVFPVIVNTPTDISLPSAGYVNLDDVDITLFSLDDPSALQAQLSQIGVGTTIWVAKSNPYDWNIYRCELVPAQVVLVSDNLDATSVVSFARPHGLAVGNYCIIKDFDQRIDGVYTVLAVPSIFDVVVQFAFVGSVTQIQGTGVAFTLQSIRVTQASNINQLPYANSLTPGSRAWVDNNGDNRWTVLEKRDPFESADSLEPQFNQANSGFGASISQGFTNQTALIGSPNYGSSGAVYPYFRNDQDQYEQQPLVTINATGTLGFGNMIDMGNQQWAVVGASLSASQQGYAAILRRIPGNNVIQATQLLVAPDLDFGPAQFGHAVTMSADERWLYVGAPKTNKVYAFQRIPVQTQTVEYITDGDTVLYNWSDHIVITEPASINPEQMTVVLDNSVLTYGSDWLISGPNIFLLDLPPANKRLRISRNSVIQLDQAYYYDIEPASNTGAGTGVKFDINRVRGTFTVTVADPGSGYSVGDVLVLAGNDIGSGDVTAGSFGIGQSYIITALGTTDFTLIGATSNTVGEIFTATGTGTGTGTAAENLVLTLTQVGPTFTTNLAAGLDTFIVTDVSDLEVGQTLVKLAGAGDFGPGAVILDIDAVSGTVTLTQPNLTAGSIEFYADPNGVYEWSQTGSGVSTTTVFPLDPYLATATNIDSFSVTVNGVLYRPELDYDFNSDSALQSLDLVFHTAPPAGAYIIVTAKDYWTYMSTLQVPAVTKSYVSVSGTTLTVSDTTGIYPGMYVAGSGFSTQRQYVTAVVNATTIEINLEPDSTPSGGLLFYVMDFGISVTTNSDGSVVIVGCTGRENAPGTAFVYDRSYEYFQVTNASQTTYTTAQSINAPIAVTLNGDFLTNSVLNLGGEFTVTGANTVSITAGQLIGDEIRVDTNHFTLMQQISSIEPYESGQFGAAVDQCINNCSLYIGAPNDGTVLPGAGAVEFWLNQARFYGAVTTLNANPALSYGDTIRINGVTVALQTTDIDGNSQPADIYSFINDINNAANSTLLQNSDPAVQARYLGLSNVAAYATPDMEFVADGVSVNFDTGNLWIDQPQANPVVTVNGTVQTLGVDYSYNVITGLITFAVPPVGNSIVLAKGGRMVISVENIEATPVFNRLTVLPGSVSLWNALGLDVYVHTQTLRSPRVQDFAHFGQSIFISDNFTTLIVGAPSGDMILPTQFDSGTTTFDSRSTVFFDSVPNSGAVYSYDLLPSAMASVNNPPQFVFGQQITDTNATTLDAFGTAVDYTTGKLLIGVPGDDQDDSQLNYGVVRQLVNIDLQPAWQVLRFQQEVVDTSLFNTVYIYNEATAGAKQYFDFFDPLQGRLLGVVRQNLDFIGAVDPASYNVGPVNNRGTKWGPSQLGQMWWDTADVRFIDPNQDDIVYASRRWGQIFPGSSVNVYQWVESTVPPQNYTGPGQPRDVNSYATVTGLDQQGFINQIYYFWVSGISTVSRNQGKTLGSTTVARYIENPRASGIAYVAPVSASAVAIYNGAEYISVQDTVLHVEFDEQRTDAAVHVQYQLIPAGKPSGFVNDKLYRKLLDSFCGSDSSGAPVPDPFLPPADKYGVDFRPRQSMFANRFLALENYLTAANAVLAEIPIVESRSSTLLFSAEPEPSAASGAWDMRVANIEQLSYQDLREVPVGYRYLVESDSTNNGLWTIYQVQTDVSSIIGAKILLLVRVQNYDTRKYWQYVDWYLPGYDQSSRIVLEVPNYASLETLDLPDGSSVKVTNAGTRWEIYRLTQGTWQRVALQNGTVQVSDAIWNYGQARYGFDSEVFDAQYFDQEPVIETRKILQGLNQDIFIGDLLYVRNELLILMFNFILTEQGAPYWIGKTSLIDVDHVIRNLQPFQIYREDNQDFVRNYIEEVKPYHTQIRQFNLIYRGNDQYDGTINDFDLPAFFDTTQNLYVSPILDNTGTLSTTSSFPSTDPIWQTLPWDQWYQNYLLSIESVSIVDGGSGYTVPPEVTVIGECEIPAQMLARINSAGQVTSIDVIDPGLGYLTTAEIVLEGGNGTGAKAVAIMGNNLVRSISTIIKYDRFKYQTDIVDWQAQTQYPENARVRYDDRVWQADSIISPASSFDPQQWTVIPAGELDGVDRTMGYYVPTVNQPGLDLALLISGIDYPGVQMQGVDFNQDTGFDVGNFDINPFDNISYGPDGQPSYDPAILDAAYSSEFADPYLGIGPAAINVEGGAFVDTYSSHAPEELVPGAVFDTLDLRVFTTPGSDWEVDGHGWPQAVRRYVFDVTDPIAYFGDLLDNIVAVNLFDVTTQKFLNQGTDYTVNWVDLTVTVIGSVSNGDTISMVASALGGGNQLYTQSVLGTAANLGVIVPIQYDLIDTFAVFVNGTVTENYSFTQYSTTQTQITFGTTYTNTDRITLTALGPTDPTINQDWAAPVTQYIVADGSLSYTLDNSLQLVNPATPVVTVNGVRARPSEGVVYIDDGSSLQWPLPDRGGYPQSTIADNDVSVWINNQQLTLGVDFVVDPYVSGVPRSITLTYTPPGGYLIQIYVRTAAQYWIVGDLIIFRPSAGLSPAAGDIVSVTTWNNTAQQYIYTAVFVGPSQKGILVSEGYDDTLFDLATVTGDPGSFDYSAGTVIELNEFPVTGTSDAAERFVVSLNGNFLFNNTNYTYDGTTLTILGPVIGPADVVAITSMTGSTVPGAVGFRIFQDMRGTQSTYRITQSTSTILTQSLLANSDIIHVQDASKLSEPDLINGIFGLITIDGERIAYRNRDIDANTVSGLRRGTAGTAAADHQVGAWVYDIGLGNYLPGEYQDRIIANNVLANGTGTVFVAPDIDMTWLDSTELTDAVQVYVGGTLQTSGYTISGASPVTVIFDLAPNQGYQVSIRVRQGQSWYAPGSGTPSNGVPLQEQNTFAATFIRGET